MNNKQNPFDQEKKIKILRRNKIAKDYEKFNFLKKYALKNQVDKLKTIKKDFNLILELGTHRGELTKEIIKFENIKKIVGCDISFEMIRLLNHRNILKINLDEDHLPFKGLAFDGILSCLYINNTNNFKNILLELKRVLKTNGFLLLSFYGASTLEMLRRVFLETEIKLLNGTSPRINNFFDMQEFGNLIYSLGFKNPVIEKEIVKVKYNSIFNLMTDLRGMGESNVSIGRRKKIESRNFFSELEKLYSVYNTNQSGIIASFEIITVSCWRGNE